MSYAQVFKQSMWSNSEKEIAHEVINWFSYVPFRGHATFSLWCKVFPFVTCDVCIKIITISDLAGAVEPLFFLFGRINYKRQLADYRITDIRLIRTPRYYQDSSFACPFERPFL